MTVKSQFLKKLRARQPAPVSFTSKNQADIAEFRLRMTQLQEQIGVWLVDTGLKVETLSISVTDLLVEGGVFDISAIVLRHDDRIVKFMPLFLYGQGVTGCVEVTAAECGCAGDSAHAGETVEILYGRDVYHAADKRCRIVELAPYSTAFPAEGSACRLAGTITCSSCA